MPTTSPANSFIQPGIALQQDHEQHGSAGSAGSGVSSSSSISSADVASLKAREKWNQTQLGELSDSNNNSVYADTKRQLTELYLANVLLGIVGVVLSIRLIQQLFFVAITTIEEE